MLQPTAPLLTGTGLATQHGSNVQSVHGALQRGQHSTHPNPGTDRVMGFSLLQGSGRCGKVTGGTSNAVLIA